MLLAVLAGLPPAAAPAGIPAWDPRDYTFLWWANGWQEHRPVEPAILCIRTGRCGFALDAGRAQIPHYGALPEAGKNQGM